MDIDNAFPLDGLKVLDFSMGVAGPTCACLLAQHGADLADDRQRIRLVVKRRVRCALRAGRASQPNVIAFRFLRYARSEIGNVARPRPDA